MSRGGRALTALLLALSAPSWGNQDSISANFWMSVCKAESTDPESAGLCTGYVKGIYDFNEMLTHTYLRPLWCQPVGVTMKQTRSVIYSYIEANPNLTHLPFIGLAAVALRRAFPCGKQ